MLKPLAKIISALVLTVSFFSVTSVSAAPIGAPFSVWSRTSAEDGKVINMTHVEQGIDWVEVTDNVRLNTFVGVDVGLSSKSQNYWENQITPEIGAKLVYNLPPVDGGYGTVEAGVAYAPRQYMDKNLSAGADKGGLKVFVTLNFGRNWNN